MHDQQADAAAIGKLFQNAHIVIICIISVFKGFGFGFDLGKRVDTNKMNLRVFVQIAA